MDIKTATKLRQHIITAPTCLTIQNSQNFISTNPVKESLLLQQIKIILEDIPISYIKIGLLPNSKIILLISKILSKHCPNIPVIIDPIIKSTTGKTLLKKEEILHLKEILIPKSYLITPNILEASILSGVKINNLQDMKIAAKILQKLGVKNILIKGGHLADKKEITHFLLQENKEEIILKNNRIKTKLDIRGTGCMLSTAIACFLNEGLKLDEAIRKADNFVNQSIKEARQIGQKLMMV